MARGYPSHPNKGLPGHVHRLPGPTLFTERASGMYALYIISILANIIVIPLGILMIRMAAQVLRAARLGLCALTLSVITRVLDLLGIAVPARM